MVATDIQARRSAATPRTPKPNARALTAAAKVLDPKDLREAARVKSYRQDWQHDAWLYYGQLPEIHFGHDYFGNVISRVRLYAGYMADTDDAPAPLDEADSDSELPEGADPQTAKAAVDEMQRLDRGADGGLAGLAGDLAVNVGLVGEGYIRGRIDLEKQAEIFEVYSTEELKATEAGYFLHRPNSTQGIEIGADDLVIRVWRRNRQFRDLADAPMMALLDQCDTLAMLNRVLYAASSSRMHGGIFLAPSEWSFPQRATDPNSEGQSKDDPLNEQIIMSTTTPLQDARSVSSVAPLLIRGPAESLDKARWIDLGRGYGDELLKQIEGVRHGIAVGLDLPIEIIEGVGTTNHWGAWQVALDTFKSHIEPLVQVICRSLTDGYLRPALEARGLDPEGFLVWYDPTALIGHDNNFENVKLMHDAYAVSDDALRRAGGASEDDAPDDDEIQRRVAIAQALKVSIREVGTAPPGEVQDDPALSDQGKGATTPPPSPANTTKAAPPAPSAVGQAKKQAAMTASAGKDRIGELGPQLHRIESRLTGQIQTLADGALQRVLERAGAQVARTVRGAPKSRTGEIAATIKGLPLGEITQTLGQQQVVALGLAEDRLIDGELGELEPEYRKLTKKALTAALLAGRRAVPDGGLDDEQVTVLAHRQDEWIAAGFAILSAAVLAAAHEQLFEPAKISSGPGEVDLSARVGTSAVRESLSVAGGSPVSSLVAGAPSGGVATGQIVMDAFRQALQVLPSGWQWVYGYPDRPFEPHENLEGVEFASWSDDVLANDESWPDVEFFRPGDHIGCACSFIPMFASDRSEGDNGEPEEG